MLLTVFLPSTPLASEANAGSGQHGTISLRPAAKEAAAGPSAGGAAAERSINGASVGDTAEAPPMPSLAATSGDSLSGDAAHALLWYQFSAT